MAIAMRAGMAAPTAPRGGAAPVRSSHIVRRAALPSRPGGARLAPLRPQVFGVRRPLGLRAFAAAGVAHPGEEANASGEAARPSPSSLGPLSASLSVPAVTMGKSGAGFGDDSGGSSSSGSSGLGAVMERSRINIVMPTPPQQAPKLDDGSGGDGIGKHNHNGGGGGGGDDDDDDDYFGEEDGDGDGSGGGGNGGGSLFFRAAALPELYDRLSIGAVLAEWYRTVAELPLFIRRAVEMGLFSSAQLVRFLSVDARPSAARSASRALPAEWARGFVGRLMADPGFLHKAALESALAFSFGLLHEARTRGESFKQELDLALVNAAGVAAAAAAAVWVAAPSRAYGAVHKFPWQQMLADLPACVFDASGPLRHYTSGARVGGLFASMAQLAGVGALAGAATSAAGGALVALRRRADPAYDGPSVPVPSVGRASGGLAAFFALPGAARYQLLGGLDRYLAGHAAHLWTYLGLSAAARAGAASAAEASRPWWQGLPAAPGGSGLFAGLLGGGGAASSSGAASAPQTARVGRDGKVRKVVRRRKQPRAVEGGEGGEAAAAAAEPALVSAAAAAALVGAAESAAPLLLAAEEAAAASTSSPSFAVDDADRVASGAAASPAPALEAGVEGALSSAPAVMGSAEALRAEAAAAVAAAADEAQQQRAGLERSLSLSDGAMGPALREAVGAES